MKKLLTALFTMAFYLAFSAGSAFAVSSGKPVAVTVSIPPQKYFVEAIGGDDVVVTVMTGKGRDPHSYEPTAAQMANIARTELYIAIGVPFESQWLPKFASLAPSMRVVYLHRNIEWLTGKPDLALRDATGRRAAQKQDTHHHAHDHAGDDPHIWLSPTVMADTVPLIVTALCKARPEKAALFTERGNELMKKTRALDAAITALFAPLAANERVFLTFHQSWAYYAHNYGLREAAVELEGREVGPKSMALLLDFATKNSIRVIVADPMTNKSALAAIANSLNAKVITATPLEENWPVAMRTFSEDLAKALRK